MRRRAGAGLALVLTGALVVGATGCTDDQPAASSATTTAPTAAASPSATSYVDIPDGRVDDAVAQLDGIIEDYLGRTGVPGLSVAVVHDGEVVHAKGFGVKDVTTGEPVDPETVFLLASLSKSVAATVVAGAVGEGLASWDDPVAQHLPGFALADPYVTDHVTLADMFSHRSGLPDHAGDLLEDMGYDRAEVLARLRDYPLSPFRAIYHYTNFGLTAAAEAVATAAGTSWEDLSDTVLYEPLGMTSTSSRHADFLARTDRATPHRLVDGNQFVPSERDPDAQSPAGGVSSNVLDMAKWMELQLAAGKADGRQVIAEDPLLDMRVPHIVSSQPDSPSSRAGFYGLGTDVSYDAAGRVRMTHAGAFFLGTATGFAMLPSEDLGIVVLTNSTPVGLPDAVTAAFMDLVETGTITRDWLAGYGGLYGRMLVNPSSLAGKQPPADPAPASPDDAYLGTYQNTLYGPATITRGQSGLVLQVGPDGMALPLTHWDGQTFAFTPPGENSLGITALTFTVDGSGRATGFDSEFYDDGNDLGTWTR